MFIKNDVNLEAHEIFVCEDKSVAEKLKKDYDIPVLFITKEGYEVFKITDKLDKILKKGV